MSNKKNIFFLISILIYLAFVILFWSYSIDDAFVTFRYAQNLTDGYGLTFNPGDEPVEGYSNFLWLIVLSFLYLIGLPIYWSAKILGVLFFFLAGLVWYANFLHEDKDYLWLIPIFYLATPFTAFWAVSGLELGMYAFILALLVAGVVKRSNWTLLLFPLVVLTRPEGFGIAIVFWAAGLIGDLINKQIERKYYLLSLLVIVVAFAALIAFRMAVFGYPMPNTFYAKSTLGIHGFLRLAKGLIYFAPLTLLFLFGLFQIIRKPPENRRFIIFSLVFLAMAAINCLANAVMNFHIRYLIAFLPFFIAISVYSLRFIQSDKLKKILILISFISIFTPTLAVFSSVNQEKNIWAAQEKLIEYVNLQPEDTRISLTDVGRIPFYTKARYYDIWGLVSGEIGHEGFNPVTEYLRFPDYFVFVGYFKNEKVWLRFGRERLIVKNRGFNHAYRYIGAGLPDNCDINREGYYYLIFRKNQRAVDSLMNLYPIKQL